MAEAKGAEPLKFMKFALVGASNTAVTWTLFFILIKGGVYYLISHVLAYGAGMLNGYFWSKRWVFKEKRRHILYLIRFIAVNLTTLSLNTFLMFLFVSKAGLDKFAALVLVTGTGLVFNYTGNRFWTFKA